MFQVLRTAVNYTPPAPPKTSTKKRGVRRSPRR
jgi:hypothetical protein